MEKEEIGRTFKNPFRLFLIFIPQESVETFIPRTNQCVKSGLSGGGHRGCEMAAGINVFAHILICLLSFFLDVFLSCYFSFLLSSCRVFLFFFVVFIPYCFSFLLSLFLAVFLSCCFPFLFLLIVFHSCCLSFLFFFLSCCLSSQSLGFLLCRHLTFRQNNILSIWMFL